MFIVKVPGVNGFGKTAGCRGAGNILIDSLKEIHGNEKGSLIDAKMLELEEIHLDNTNLEITQKLIYENALEIFDEKLKTIFLGGDHFATFSLVRAFFEHCKRGEKDFCLILFDSGPDCREEKGGEKGIYPSNKNWLRYLIEASFPRENVFLAGIRNYSPSELAFLKKNRIKFLGVNAFLENLEDSCDILMEFAKDKEAYLSIDLSVIDPAFAPGISEISPGGLTSREFIYLVQRLNLIRKIRAVDIVELNSDTDFNKMTSKLGAKILSEFL